MTRPVRLQTYFDSPQRTPMSVIQRTAADLASSPIVRGMMEGMPTAAVLLNRNRQIVAQNTRAVALFDAMSPADIHGLRLGEALACVCAHTEPAGCGTSPGCAECGAAHAIKAAREANGSIVRECRLTTAHNGAAGALDVRVTVTPIEIEGHQLQLVALEDIADEKRREALERIFFHDVLGTGTAVHGLARLVGSAGPDQLQDVSDALVRATGQLLEEIQSQRDLMLAERGQLEPRVGGLSVNEALDGVYQAYRWSPLCEGRELVCEPMSADVSVNTDRTQIGRCLGNLVRNALEAVADGDRVSLSARAADGGVQFDVMNPGYIPPSLQLQIFQRSFSTKARRGRGLGTYSVRLIVEQYLGGRVSFVSDVHKGTTFSIWLPGATPTAG